MVRAPGYRKAFQRLEEALAKSSALSGTERLDLVRLRLFGVLAGSEEPGKVTPPGSTTAQ